MGSPREEKVSLEPGSLVQGKIQNIQVYLITQFSWNVWIDIHGVARKGWCCTSIKLSSKTPRFFNNVKSLGSMSNNGKTRIFSTRKPSKPIQLIQLRTIFFTVLNTVEWFTQPHCSRKKKPYLKYLIRTYISILFYSFLSLITFTPDTIHKPPKCDNKETIFWSMLQSMLKLTSTKAVVSIKEFTQALQIRKDIYHMYMLGSGNDAKPLQ